MRIGMSSEGLVTIGCNEADLLWAGEQSTIIASKATGKLTLLGRESPYNQVEAALVALSGCRFRFPDLRFVELTFKESALLAELL